MESAILSLSKSINVLFKNSLDSSKLPKNNYRFRWFSSDITLKNFKKRKQVVQKASTDPQGMQPGFFFSVTVFEVLVKGPPNLEFIF